MSGPLPYIMFKLISRFATRFGLRTATLLVLISAGIGMMPAQSEIEWVDGREHNFGTVSESDSVVSHRFVMRNGGDEPFSIVSATPRCRCTKAEFNQRVLQPGDTTSVVVSFFPGNIKGNTIQRVAVVTSSRSRISYLFIKGFVIAQTNEAESQQPDSNE